MKIDRFTGEYAFLSNFHYSPFMYFAGKVAHTAEHAFQAAKATTRADYMMVMECRTPGQAKRAGRRVNMREDWQELKERVMMTCLRLKFAAHPDLREKLLATGSAELIEGNHWGDTYWGVCKGVGQNRLGILLMQLREELRHAI